MATLHQLADHFIVERPGILAERTKSSRHSNGRGSSGASGGADCKNLSNLAGASGIEDETASEWRSGGAFPLSVSMVMSDTDVKDLDCGAGDDNRSTSAGETRVSEGAR